MIAVGNKQTYNNVFSRIIYSNNSTFSNNMNASNLNYNLIFKGIYIMNNDTLLSLFYDDHDRILLGTVVMSNFSFILKQTLPN
jgi:hypothetical protein